MRFALNDFYLVNIKRQRIPSPPHLFFSFGFIAFRTWLGTGNPLGKLKNKSCVCLCVFGFTTWFCGWCGKMCCIWTSLVKPTSCRAINTKFALMHFVAYVKCLDRTVADGGSSRCGGTEIVRRRHICELRRRTVDERATTFGTWIECADTLSDPNLWQSCIAGQWVYDWKLNMQFYVWLKVDDLLTYIFYP